MSYQLSPIPEKAILHLTVILKLAVVLAVALVLKYHYSIASVNDLRWILAPTTFMVEAITGRQFAFESQAGYMSSDHTFLIAASCSGLNFMIIAFLMLTLGELWRERHIGWKVLPSALLIAYVSTILANTVRIVIALFLNDRHFEVNELIAPDELHRLEGIVVYFGALLVLFFINEKFRGAGRLGRHDLFRGSKYLLAVYYAVTLGIPVLRGSYRSSEFWEHSVWVIVVPLVIIIPTLMVVPKTVTACDIAPNLSAPSR